MAVYKMMDDFYGTLNDYWNLLNYICDDSRHTICYIGNTFIFSKVKEEMFTELWDNKKKRNKLTGRFATHHIISLSEEEMRHITPHQLLEIGYKIAALTPEYGAVFAVHEECDNLHLHMMIDCAPMYGNKKFHLSHQEFIQRRNDIFEIIGSYILHNLKQYSEYIDGGTKCVYSSNDPCYFCRVIPG